MSSLNVVGMSSDSESDDDSLSPENGFRCVPEPSVDLEELLLAVGEIVGCENIVSASDWDDEIGRASCRERV